MDDDIAVKVLKRLKDEVQNLAAPAEIQRAYLQGKGFVESADELALEFGESYVLVDQLWESGRLTTNARDALTCLNDRLDHLSGPANEKLWRLSALDTAVEWNDVRSAALRVLYEFD